MELNNVPTLTTDDNTELHYIDQGAGTPLLFLPGWGTTTQWFENQVAELAHSFRVVSYDPRGQGQSAKTSCGQRMERHTKDLDQVISQLGLNNCVLIGWSLGVSTILSYVDVHGTANITKFVLVSGCARMVNGDDWNLGFLDLPQTEQWVSLLRADMDGAADFVVPQLFSTKRTDDEYKRFRDDTASCAGAAEMCWNVLNQDYRDVLQKIDKPTLILMGRQDKIFSEANAQYLDKSITSSDVVMLEDSGHTPFIEEPDRFNSEVARFARA